MASMDGAPFSLAAPQPGDYGWVLERHAVTYAAEHGWGADFESLVASVIADVLAAPDVARGWIARDAAGRLGSIALTRIDAGTAQLRLLLVEPRARGRGVGAALIDALLDRAQELGYSRVRLWTTDVLGAARALYARAGFRRVSSKPNTTFDRRVMDEIWELEVAERRPLRGR